LMGGAPGFEDALTAHISVAALTRD
jgi:hypothetical protein